MSMHGQGETDLVACGLIREISELDRTSNEIVCSEKLKRNFSSLLDESLIDEDLKELEESC